MMSTYNQIVKHFILLDELVWKENVHITSTCSKNIVSRILLALTVAQNTLYVFIIICRTKNI